MMAIYKRLESDWMQHMPQVILKPIKIEQVAIDNFQDLSLIDRVGKVRRKLMHFNILCSLESCSYLSAMNFFSSQNDKISDNI